MPMAIHALDIGMVIALLHGVSRLVPEARSHHAAANQAGASPDSCAVSSSECSPGCGAHGRSDGSCPQSCFSRTP